MTSRPSTRSVSTTGEANATIVDNVYASRMQHKVASGVLTRSLVQRNSKKLSGSGGEPPTLPHPC